MSDLSPLSGAKLKSGFGAIRAAFDPTRTSGLTRNRGRLYAISHSPLGRKVLGFKGVVLARIT
jgi:hypothetical protein